MYDIQFKRHHFKWNSILQYDNSVKYSLWCGSNLRTDSPLAVVFEVPAAASSRFFPTTAVFCLRSLSKSGNLSLLMLSWHFAFRTGGFNPAVFRANNGSNLSLKKSRRGLFAAESRFSGGILSAGSPAEAMLLAT